MAISSRDCAAGLRDRRRSAAGGGGVAPACSARVMLVVSVGRAAHLKPQAGTTGRTRREPPLSREPSPPRDRRARVGPLHLVTGRLEYAGVVRMGRLLACSV